MWIYSQFSKILSKYLEIIIFSKVGGSGNSETSKMKRFRKAVYFRCLIGLWNASATTNVSLNKNLQRNTTFDTMFKFSILIRNISVSKFSTEKSNRTIKAVIAK